MARAAASSYSLRVRAASRPSLRGWSIHAAALPFVLGACSSGGASRPAPQPSAPPAARGDAGPPPVTSIALDVGSGMHLDDGVVHHAPSPEGRHARRPIDVILRSSPPGAMAAVDGVRLGNTPAYWSGEADGREHEFTFELAGYSMARYRFVPITSGIVHARLTRVADESHADPPPEIAPRPPVDPQALAPSPGPTAPAPPPTLVAPIDAAPAAVTPPTTGPPPAPTPTPAPTPAPGLGPTP